MDDIQKAVGVPFSTSRTFEKAMKKKTQKARRQMSLKEINEQTMIYAECLRFPYGMRREGLPDFSEMESMQIKHTPYIGK